jgi:hypothetical protein
MVKKDAIPYNEVGGGVKVQLHVSFTSALDGGE